MPADPIGRATVRDGWLLWRTQYDTNAVRLSQIVAISVESSNQSLLIDTVAGGDWTRVPTDEPVTLLNQIVGADR